MNEVTAKGKTIDDAILSAVTQLGKRRENLNIEIIEEPVKGILGMFGSKEAVIKASVKKTTADRAKDYLLGLFEKMGFEVQVDSFLVDDSLKIELSGDNMGILIGYRGETLDALQYLVSLFVNNGTEDYKRVIIDTENYRSKREDNLIKLAKKLAMKVQKTKRNVTLEPMNPYERRIIHSALQSYSFIKTHSEGNEPYRKVVISHK